MLSSATTPSIVKATSLSHGTITCRDLAKSRRFYEQFLGLEVQHFSKPAMMLKLHQEFYIACICLGEKAQQNSMWSHFGFNVSSREEVDRIYAEAIRLKEDYELQVVEKPRELHGAYQFYLQDRDTNWWEIQYEPRSTADFFALPDLDTSQISPAQSGD